MGSLLDHFGIMLGSCQDYIGISLGVILEPLWVHVGIILLLRWDHGCIMLKSCGLHVGIISVWVTLGSLWNRRNRIQRTTTEASGEPKNCWGNPWSGLIRVNPGITLGSFWGDAGITVTVGWGGAGICLLYTSPSPRDLSTSRMPSSA